MHNDVTNAQAESGDRKCCGRRECLQASQSAPLICHRVAEGGSWVSKVEEIKRG